MQSFAHAFTDVGQTKKFEAPKIGGNASSNVIRRKYFIKGGLDRHNFLAEADILSKSEMTG